MVKKQTSVIHSNVRGPSVILPCRPTDQQITNVIKKFEKDTGFLDPETEELSAAKAAPSPKVKAAARGKAKSAAAASKPKAAMAKSAKAEAKTKSKFSRGRGRGK